MAGAGEGMDRVTVPVDMVPPGGQRQEIWVDARDLQPEDAEGNAIPLEDYKAQLVQRGREKLAGYPLVESVEACIDPDANLAYRKDFDLGDLCTYINADRHIRGQAHHGSGGDIRGRGGKAGRHVRKLRAPDGPAADQEGGMKAC